MPTIEDRFVVYAVPKHRKGIGASAWAVFDPGIGEIKRREVEPLMLSKSPTLLTLNGLIAGLPETPEGATVTCVAPLAKLIEMAQRLAEYRLNGFRSSGKPIANLGLWLQLADLVSKRSVEFRTFRKVGKDRKVAEELILLIQGEMARGIK